MTNWILSDSDFYTYLHAAVWALCAGEAYVAARAEERRSWQMFARGCALKSAAEFLALLRFTATAHLGLAYAAPALEAVAFIGLFVAAVYRLKEIGRPQPPLWLIAPLALFCAWKIGALLSPGPWVRVSLGFFGLTALALAMGASAKRERPRDVCLGFACFSWIGYAGVLGYSALVSLGAAPSTLFGVQTEGPAAVAQMLFVVAVLVALHLRRRNLELSQLTSRRAWTSRLTVRAALCVTLIAGAWWSAQRLGARHDLSRRLNALSRVNLAAAAVPQAEVRDLTWNLSDLTSPAYADLKHLMTAMVHSEYDLRFVLLAGLRDGKAVFIVDSEPPTSADYSPPGQIYEEAAADYVDGMRSRKPFVLGPVTDRWGTWIIASAPINTGDPAVIANAELDISAANWEQSIRAARLPAFIVGFLLLILSLTFFDAHERVAESLSRMKSSRDAAEAASRAKSEFLAVMSHEIRTPLGAVIGMLELMRRHPTEAERQRYTTLARHSAELLLHLLDDILDAAKVEAGKVVLEEKPFDLREECSQALGGMRVRAEGKDLWFRWHFADNVPQVVIGDPTRLKQIIANLTSNAVKFTSAGGVETRFSARAIEKDRFTLCIEVIDTGIGMAPDVQARLFNKFEQADASTTRQYGGTGLGLAIVKGLVERMGGAVTVKSSPNEGTCFRIEAPFRVGNSAALAASEENGSVDELPCPPLRVLYAEDDPVNREYLDELLKRFGHEVTLAENGREALQLVAQREFDVVLMDNRMPVMDGFQTSIALRNGAAGTAKALIHIVAVTANATPNYRDACLAAGMNDFIAKPVRPGHLAAALHRAATKLGRIQSSTTGSTNPGLSAEALLASLEDSSPARTQTAPPAVIAAFLSETPRRLETIRQGLTEQDFETIGRIAHTLKGSSHYVDAEALGSLGAEIEKLAESRDARAIEKAIDAAEKAFAAAKRKLQTAPAQILSS